MKPVLHNGAAYMMGGDLFGISDLFGLVLSRVEPETQNQALGIAALAIIITRTKATPGIIKAELTAEVNSAKMAGPLAKNLTKMCFTKGTLVAAKNGTKKIEEVKKGDWVWSYNETTGRKELKKVVALSQNMSSSLVKISVNGTEITCTPEHPFYVNGSWIEAKDLTKGMSLAALEGTTSPVESIKFLDEKVKVYNFEVEGNHNYYVSEKGILVHNDCEWPFKKVNAEVLKYASCDADALAIQKVVGGNIMTVSNPVVINGRGLGLGPVKYGNETIGNWFYHKAVRVDDTVFDRLTGPSGMHIDDYKKLFEYADDLIFK
jgi:hypothetical protein